jgi:hypothetical protein
MTPIQISAIIALLGHSLAGLKGSPETPDRISFFRVQVGCFGVHFKLTLSK